MIWLKFKNALVCLNYSIIIIILFLYKGYYIRNYKKASMYNLCVVKKEIKLSHDISNHRYKTDS